LLAIKDRGGTTIVQEAHLSTLFGALIEEVTLAKRMRVTPEFKETAR
jgi:hypothetical protein